MELVYLPLPHDQVFKKTFVAQYEYDAAYENDREYVVEMVKQARKNRLRIHKLIIEEVQVGFIAFSVNRFENRPCLYIDYLFVSHPFRSETYPELEGMTLGEQLLGYACTVAEEINSNAPIRFLALEPANDRLRRYYLDRGFTKLDQTDCLFSKLDNH